MQTWTGRQPMKDMTMNVLSLTIASAFTFLLGAALAPSAAAQSVAGNTQVLHVYGPGGPLPAMKEAAATFGREHHLQVVVTGGPTSQWLPGAKQDGDLIYSGSEDMMSDFVTSLQGVLDSSTIVPLYLRESAILVRPGNPGHISGLEDLLKPGRHILVVNGAGQRGLWEDVAGREGDMASVSKFRANIAVFAPNSGVARTDWIHDQTLDAWLIWNIWQISNPSLAEVVRIDERHRIYRDCGIGLTVRGASSADARAFIQFLQSPEGAKIFENWGWNSHR
jgi:accessory colonization factor AcfC